MLSKLCFEKKTKKSVVETFKECFAGFCEWIFGEKKYFRRHFRENQQKTFATFSRFWPLKGLGWGERVNPLKKQNLRQSFF